MATTTRTKNGYTRADWTDFVHTGPGTLAGRFTRLFWHPVYAAEDLRPGRAVPMTIMSEKFTLYRGQSGTPHAVAFRCAHRGTQLSTGWVEGDDIRCRYHGWKYAPTGQCIEQPCEPEPFCEEIGIRSYPVEDYLGLIFVYMGEGTPAPLPRYPEFEDTDGIVEVVKPHLSESNYFRRIEQMGDHAHLMWAHRHEKPYYKLENPTLEATETEYGIAQTTHYPNGKTTVSHYVVPNVAYMPNQTPMYPEETDPRERIMWRVPVDDEHYLNLGVLLIHMKGESARRYRESQAERAEAWKHANTSATLAAILAGEMTREEVENKSDISHLEDEVVLVGMGKLEEGPVEGRLGRTDVALVLRRKIWEREMRALAEGQPLKQWRRPGRLAGSPSRT